MVADLHDDQSDARQQVRELTNLFSALAHEIKNPLSVINLNMDLLAEDLERIPGDDARRATNRVEIVQRQCQRLETLLKDFVGFVRLNQLSLVPGSLNDQVRQVLDFFAPQAQSQGVEVRRFLDADLPGIRLAPRLLQSALTNLIKNSLEAMPDGGQLVVRTHPVLHGIALDIIDTGHGMSHETSMRMFDTFFTTKKGGTGLGLPTAQKIIEAHGGVIDVQSELGRGTKFTIVFPVFKRIDP
jgi:signal transduction histidine kinase